MFNSTTNRPWKSNFGYMPEYVSNLVTTSIRVGCVEFTVINIPHPNDTDIRWRIKDDGLGKLAFEYTNDNGVNWTRKVYFDAIFNKIATTAF